MDKYDDKKSLLASSSVLCKRQKFREAFRKYTETQNKKISKLHNKLAELKSVYNRVVLDIESAMFELNKSEDTYEKNEIELRNHISYLATKNNDLENKLVCKLYSR